MVKDISEYLCSREECLKDINESIKSCSRKELVNKMSFSDCCKLDKNIRNKFFVCNYDETGHVFLFDEVSPKLVSKYIIDNVSLETDDEIVYAYVCRVQMNVINEFYKEMATGQRVLRFCKSVNSMEEYEAKYYRLVEERLKHPIKRLRGK